MAPVQPVQLHAGVRALGRKNPASRIVTVTGAAGARGSAWFRRPERVQGLAQSGTSISGRPTAGEGAPVRHSLPQSDTCHSHA